MGAKATHKVDTTQRLADLRQLLQKHQLQAFVVPTEDQRVCFVYESFEIINKVIQTRASISRIVINDGLSFLGSTVQQVRLDSFIS